MRKLIMLQINYTYEGIQYQATQSNEHFDIIRTEKNNITIVKIETKKTITNVKPTLYIDYNFKASERIFTNGYQSWTDSKEYFVDEKLNSLNRFTLPIVKLLGDTGKGDYSMKNYYGVAGVFHGYSYSYMRDEKNFDLICSLNERNGYTIINFDCPNNKIFLEKDLEGVVINGEYELFNFGRFVGTENVVFDKYFAELSIPKPRFDKKCGYTSWYNYYQNITAADIEKDLEAMKNVDCEYDIFQIDDGYQTAVGDWLSLDQNKFPNGIKCVREKISQSKMTPGIWLAPLCCEKKSKIYKEHNDWILRDEKGKLVKAGLNWSGFYALDFYKKEVREYIKNVFDTILNDWGFEMVKLDFLYAASIIPYRNKSRAEVMYDAMEFIRACVGDKIILGCGVPLAPSYGLVDFCRIGADISLTWKMSKLFGTREGISTELTLNNTIFRRQLDNRAFRNDPDVFLLRDYKIKLNNEQKRIISTINKICGSLLFTSDRVSTYDESKMKIFKETMKKDNIEVISAKYVNLTDIEIMYTLNGEEKIFTYNSSIGKIICE